MMRKNRLSRTRLWRLGLGAVAVPSLALAGYALAAGATVSLTSTGPQPNQLTVGWGDTLTFVNRDSESHDLTVGSPPLASATLAPGASYTVVMTIRAGQKSFVESGGKRGYRGRILVTAAGTVSLKTSRPTVRYGESILLTGKSSLPGLPVSLEARSLARGSWTTIATLDADSSGVFSTALFPIAGELFRATAAGGQLRSPVVSLTVEPVLSIQVSGHVAKVGHVVAVRVKLAPAQAADSISLMAYSPQRGRWIAVASQRPGPAGGVVFHWAALPGRSLLRAAVGERKRTGYSPAASASVVVTGIGSAPPASSGSSRHSTRARPHRQHAHRSHRTSTSSGRRKQ